MISISELCLHCVVEGKGRSAELFLAWLCHAATMSLMFVLVDAAALAAERDLRGDGRAINSITPPQTTPVSVALNLAGVKYPDVQDELAAAYRANPQERHTRARFWRCSSSTRTGA